MSNLISRADAIEAVRIIADKMTEHGKVCMEQAVSILEALPSADAVSREEWSNLVEEYNNTIGAILAVISAPTGIKEISDHFAELIKEEQTDSVVRCKDCRHYNPIDENKPYPCGYGMYMCNKDDFCSYGERREE